MINPRKLIFPFVLVLSLFALFGHKKDRVRSESIELVDAKPEKTDSRGGGARPSPVQGLSGEMIPGESLY